MARLPSAAALLVLTGELRPGRPRCLHRGADARLPAGDVGARGDERGGSMAMCRGCRGACVYRLPGESVAARESKTSREREKAAGGIQIVDL